MASLEIVSEWRKARSKFSTRRTALPLRCEPIPSARAGVWYYFPLFRLRTGGLAALFPPPMDCDRRPDRRFRIYPHSLAFFNTPSGCLIRAELYSRSNFGLPVSADLTGRNGMDCIVAVSATLLCGLHTPPGAYEWLRGMRPAERIGSALNAARNVNTNAASAGICIGKSTSACRNTA
jgi:hypothetical protein